MDDTMKEEKVGKKGKGMVLVISVGKPSDKNPANAADPDKQEKMDQLSSELSRRGKVLSNANARMGAGRQVRNQVRYQQGDLDDPNAEPEEEAPKLADDVSIGHSGRRGSKEEAEAFESGKPLMQRLQEEEDRKKPQTEEEDLYANIFDSMKRASFDATDPYAGFHVEPPASSSPADVEAFRERTRQKLKEMKEQGLIHPTESNPAGLPPPTLAQERMGTSLTPAFISKATPAELMEEAQRLREAGEKGQARRFSDVASQMERGPALAESTISRLGMQAAQALDPEEEDQEAFARFLYGEGKAGADYQDMRLNPNFYDPAQRREFMRLMSQIQRQKNRADSMGAEGEAQLAALREEDPTQFFADQDMVQRAYPSPADLAWVVLKAQKRDPRLARAGVSGFNKPKRTPKHPKKSHVVVAREGGKVKTIRFGQQGVSGSPKKQGESSSYRKRRESFKARHAKNINRGKLSAAYWADKVKW
jgi:hypothetical protein